MSDVDEAAYNRVFRWIVTSGITCGLDHPIEWAINAWRTPGGTLSEAYYQEMRAHLPRFLVEMYQTQGPGTESATARDILQWVEGHYSDDRFNGFFDFLTDEITAALKGAAT